jgi:hypothetical protein
MDVGYPETIPPTDDSELGDVVPAKREFERLQTPSELSLHRKTLPKLGLCRHYPKMRLQIAARWYLAAFGRSNRT